VLDTQTTDLARVRPEVASLKQELEDACKGQEEVAALKRDHAETRKALADKESDVTQLRDSNARLNNEVVDLTSEGGNC
jgi:predicted  nucleic acid-binding Zn-ribbon protein